MRKKLNILIISYYFGPIQAIGSIRSTKLAKYLKKMGHNVIVLSTSNYKLFPEDKLLKRDIQDIKVYRTPSIDALWISSKVKRFISLLRFKRDKKRYGGPKIYMKSIRRILLGELIYKIIKMPNITWFLFSLPVLKKILKKNEFDIIFSSFGPIFVHYLGLFAKKKQPNSYWIVDYRDLHLENYTNPPDPVSRVFNRIIEQKILEKADIITAVSKGFADVLKLKVKNKEKVHIIYNGYDPDDIKDIKIRKERKTFRIIYTGSIRYKFDKGKTLLFQDPLLLFEALSKFKKKRNIEFFYLGKNIEAMRRLIDQFDLEDIVVYRGYLERNEALKEQLRAHISLLLTWGLEKSQGMLPAKFYEYIMTGNKILCIIKGKKEYNEITEIITKYRLGLVVDTDSDRAENVRKIIRFLTKVYNDFINGKSTGNKRLELFNYKNIASKIVEIYENRKIE